MGVYITSAAFFVAWLVTWLVFGKGGFVHILLMAAVSIALAQFLQERRTAEK